MEFGEFLAALRGLGLDEDEARLYVQLSRNGPSTSTEVAVATKMNRISAYRCLLRLRDKGFADSMLERPIRFSAVPIDDAMANVVSSLKNEVRRVEGMGDTLKPVWSSIQGSVAADSQAHRFKLVHGRHNIVRTLERMYEFAERDILFFTTRSGVIRGLKAGGPTLAALGKSARSIRMLGPIDQDNVEFAKQWMEFAHVRHVGIADYVRFCIVDDKQILNVLNFADNARLAEDLDVGLWTDSRQYVLAQRTFFRIMWDQGVDLPERVKELERKRRKGTRQPRASGARPSVPAAQARVETSR